MPSKKKLTKKNAAKKHPLDGKPVYLGTARIVSSDSLPEDTVEFQDLPGCSGRGTRASCPACTGLEPEEQDAIRRAFADFQDALDDFEDSLSPWDRVRLWWTLWETSLLWVAVGILAAFVLWGR